MDIAGLTHRRLAPIDAPSGAVPVAIVGCGAVAANYWEALCRLPSVRIAGVFDQDQQRLSDFANRHRVSVYSSFEAVLSDPEVAVVVNLVSPTSHAGVTRAALGSGKHVSTRKNLWHSVSSRPPTWPGSPAIAR
jgi:predicted dehydrogenase